ncbi:MAG TPA: TSUP family transporter [Clostridia bacterium]|nr:TSUP family transporter [Clostridia bacterium]
MIHAVIGIISGILAGMGLGGGSLLIPILVIFLDVGQKAAQAANIISFIPAALISIILHNKNKLIKIRSIIWVAIAGAAAAAVSSFCAVGATDGLLKKTFAAFLIIAGLLELFNKN